VTVSQPDYTKESGRNRIITVLLSFGDTVD